MNDINSHTVPKYLKLCKINKKIYYCKHFYYIKIEFFLFETIGYICK